MDLFGRVGGRERAVGRRPMLWVAAIVVLVVAGCGSPVAFQPATPTPAPVAPGIRLYPTAVQAGDVVTVTGNGWPANTAVTLYLSTPESVGTMTEQVAGATADTYGRFSTTFVVPVGEAWQGPGNARVVARSQDGSRVVHALLSLDAAHHADATTETTSPVAAASAPRPAPISSTPPIPSTTPVVSDTSQADVADVVGTDGSVSVTSTVDLNVRLGPGVAYPVVAAMRVGEPATVTGANEGGTWLRIRLTGDADDTGWVSRGYVIADDLSGVPVVEAPPLPATPTPTVTPTPEVAATAKVVEAVAGGWQGEYFDNITLSGSPVFVRSDGNLDFGWGDQGPGGGLAPQYFSVRWTQAIHFSEGTYFFTVTADDGVRLWVDGALKLDEWRDTDPTTYYPIIWLSEGTHTLQVEYYQHLANSTIRVAWHKESAWHARYYNNKKMADEAVLDRYEDDVNYNWGTGAPDAVVAADNFSAIWTRKYTFEEDLYVFTVEADDGVRLKVDGEVLLESWTDGTRTLRAEHHFDDKGEREVRVEYYEHYGDAHIKVSWRRD